MIAKLEGDRIVLPGIASAHSHAFQRALRGRTQRARGSFFSWREQMYELAAKLDPDDHPRPLALRVRRARASRSERRRRVPLRPPSARWDALRGSERAGGRGDARGARRGDPHHAAPRALPAAGARAHGSRAHSGASSMTTSNGRWPMWTRSPRGGRTSRGFGSDSRRTAYARCRPTGLRRRRASARRAGCRSTCM